MVLYTQSLYYTEVFHWQVYTISKKNYKWQIETFKLSGRTLK